MTRTQTPLITLVAADNDQRALVRLLLQQHGYQVMGFGVYQRLLDFLALGGDKPALVMVAFSKFDRDDETFLATFNKLHPHLPMVGLLPPDEQPHNIPLVKKVLRFTLMPPLTAAMLDATVKRCLAPQQPVHHNSTLPLPLTGSSAQAEALRRQCLEAANTNANVFIGGENGFHRKSVAWFIHQNQNAGFATPTPTEKPFVYINCAAVPEQHLENVLLGDPETGRIGKFQQAAGGSLMLDEIRYLPASLQRRLVEILQEKEVVLHTTGLRYPADFRLFCGCSNNHAVAPVLEELWYHISVLNITLPPFAQRQEDLHDIIATMVQRYSSEDGANTLPTLTNEAQVILAAQPWPGGLRQLETVIRRALLRCGYGNIETAHLYPLTPNPCFEPERHTGLADGGAAIKPLEVMEREYIERALAICEGSISAAAKRLGMGRATLYRKLKSYETK